MDFGMLFVDHREVLHGEQEWQDAYPVVSKFIAYSGAELKQDSLLVYYSIDGGAYQVAHMTATGNPDEYVGYITGYQGGSQIDYYVFGADESGRRYTQPVFAELDPHHFTVGAHQPSGELVFTKDTLWIEDDGFYPFSIINETAEEVVIESYDAVYSFGNNKYLQIDHEGLLPYTLSPGSTFEITVSLGTVPILPKGHVEARLNIVTSLGVRTVIVEVLDTAIDCGLYTSETVYMMNEPSLVVGVTNGNTGTQTPIEITSITEDDNPTGIPYLMIEPPYQLPYSLSAGEHFQIHLGIHPNAKEQERAYTQVHVHSSQNTITFGIYINDALLSVSERPAETKLYPNPTEGLFTVEGANVTKVEVYNLVGQKVHEAEGKTVNIDATAWNQGIYLVNIKHQNGAVETKKLVVK